MPWNDSMQIHFGCRPHSSWNAHIFNAHSSFPLMVREGKLQMSHGTSGAPGGFWSLCTWVWRHFSPRPLQMRESALYSTTKVCAVCLLIKHDLIKAFFTTSVLYQTRTRWACVFWNQKRGSNSWIQMVQRWEKKNAKHSLNFVVISQMDLNRDYTSAWKKLLYLCFPALILDLYACAYHLHTSHAHNSHIPHHIGPFFIFFFTFQPLQLDH